MLKGDFTTSVSYAVVHPSVSSEYLSHLKFRGDPTSVHWRSTEASNSLLLSLAALSSQQSQKRRLRNHLLLCSKRDMYGGNKGHPCINAVLTVFLISCFWVCPFLWSHMRIIIISQQRKYDYICSPVLEDSTNLQQMLIQHSVWKISINYHGGVW